MLDKLGENMHPVARPGTRPKHRRINVAVVGVGNCASSLVQGISYYTQEPGAHGLIHRSIADYTASSLHVRVARGRTWVTTGRWPVCAIIARSDLPAFAAAVARPALRL